MVSPESNLYYSVDSQQVFIKINQRATYNISETFKSLVLDLVADGVDILVLDLSACEMMDSTFLGMLAGLGRKHPHRTNQEGLQLRLVLPNIRIRDSLENLDALQLFEITEDSRSLPRTYRPAPPRSTPATKEQLAHNSLEAHQHLMSLNPSNIPKFKDVARLLEEELKRIPKKP